MNKTDIATIIGTFVALIQLHKWGLFKKIKSLYYLNKWAINKSNNELLSVYRKKELYIYDIGKKHKELREKYLELSLREISNIYKTLSPHDIEQCELGEKELPKEFIEKLINFFFIEEAYLDKGEKPTFKTVDSDLDKYVGEGYNPWVLCPPDEENEIFSSLYFIKKEKSIERSFQYDNYLNFHSLHGGKNDVLKLIFSLLKNNKDTHIPIVKVDLEIWKEIKSQNFYLKEEKLRRFRANYDYQEVYNDWVNEVKEHKI